MLFDCIVLIFLLSLSLILMFWILSCLILSYLLGPGNILPPIHETKTTSSISLQWKAAQGDNVQYIVQWNNKQMKTGDLPVVLDGLTPGTNYTITIVPIASDNQTKGEAYIFSSFTSKSHILYF